MSTPDLLSPSVRGSFEAVQHTAQELGARLLRDLDVHEQQLRREYGDAAVERFLFSMGGERLRDDVRRALRCIYVPPRMSQTVPGVMHQSGGGALWEWAAGLEEMAERAKQQVA